MSIDPALPPTPDRPAPADVIRSLGFDPATVRAVILTPSTAVAIAADYPEPYVPPGEPDTPPSEPAVPPTEEAP